MSDENKVEVISICYDEQFLALKRVENKKAHSVFNAIMSVLNEHSLRPEILVCDTEPTNAGRKNGVVKKLKEAFPNLIFEPCRLHVLDLVLKHQFSKYFDDKTKSRDLQYDFVDSLQINWQTFRLSYLSSCAAEEVEEVDSLLSLEKRREDYQFLLKLVKALKFYRQNNNQTFFLPKFQLIVQDGIVVQFILYWRSYVVLETLE